MELDRSARGRPAKAWDPAAAVNAAAGAAVKVRAARAEDKASVAVVVLAAAVGKAELQNQFPLLQTIQTKTNLSKERRAIMPMGDRTGPMGQGPRTGRAAGFCAGFNSPGYLNRGPGFRFGRGWGRDGGRGWGGGGRGWRHWFYATGLTGWQRAAAGLPPFGLPPPDPAWSAQTELDQLRQQAEFLQKTLDAVQQRINQLAAEGPKDQADKPGASA